MWKFIYLPLAIILAAAGIILVQHNNQTAKQQSDAIITADNAGQDTTAALAQLKTYVKDHSDTQVGFTLTAAYQRAQAAAAAQAAATAGNAQVYADAQKACSGHTDSITQAKCNEQYLAAHLQALPAPSPVVAPKSADFQYDLHGPVWTPDGAGLSFAGAVVAAVLAIIGIAMGRRRA